MSNIERRVLLVDPRRQAWRLETLTPETVDSDTRHTYLVLSGETLCQALLRRAPQALVIARGPLAFLSGNKASIGYISPLTGLPHYSFVGGRAAAQLRNLGLDAICFQPLDGDRPPTHSVPRASAAERPPYLVVSGRVPELDVEFKTAAPLPGGQRSAYYWLLEHELDGERPAGSIVTLGEGARHGYLTANLAGEAIFHAGRGGAGSVFSRYASALVLRGRPLRLAEFWANTAAFEGDPNAWILPLLEKYCYRLSCETGGTVTKLETTGKSTLPAFNAQQLGYALADLGGKEVLRAIRQGQVGCQWCQVDCRHWHWLAVDYAPGGRDLFLDDFQPMYAIFAMLGLTTEEDSLQARLELFNAVSRRVMLPLEQMGCDALDIGLGLAALLEGVQRGLIPASDVPDFVSQGRGLGDLEAIVRAVDMLRSGQARAYAALRQVGDGPQALAERYPLMQDIVFTSGRRTLGNPGHCNALWTFLMPFSRFFGHYSGQFYKVEGRLPPPGSGLAEARAVFEPIVRRLLAREFYGLLANALSQCAFVFVIYSQDGEGERLSDDDLLVQVLQRYGMRTTRADLERFCQAFWAQSIDFKCQFGWRPPTAADFPRRVYEGLALATGRPVEELQALMELLIDEWKRQAAGLLTRFGYAIPW